MIVENTQKGKEKRWNKWNKYKDKYTWTSSNMYPRPDLALCCNLN